MEGSAQQRVDAQVTQFLTEETPESALQDAQKFPHPLRQLKDRNGQIRGLGVWCKGNDFDLFVTQVLYKKPDESRYLPRSQQLADRGKEYTEKFEDFGLGEIEEKAAGWRQRDDLLLFQSE